MLHINSFTLVYNVTNDKYRLTVFGLDPSHNAYSHIVVSSTVSSVLLDHFKGPAYISTNILDMHGGRTLSRFIAVWRQVCTT